MAIGNMEYCYLVILTIFFFLSNHQFDCNINFATRGLFGFFLRVSVQVSVEAWAHLISIPGKFSGMEFS